jgi:peptidoglycan/LPS O-acetylase OafA/YrhL
LVSIGAGAAATGLTRTLCELSGRISYSIRMIHYAAAMVFANYCWPHGIDMKAMLWVIRAITPALVGFTYLLLAFYDEPLRQAALNQSKQGRLLVNR